MSDLSLRAWSSAAVLTLLVTLLPVVASAQGPLSDIGSPDGGQQGTHAWDAAGPVIAGPDYIAPFSNFPFPGRDARLIADSEGHLLVQGRIDLGEQTVERLVALNAADGTVAWSLEGIEATCLPVATDDGRIFAQLERNVTAGGATTRSMDPVEIDAATGAVTNRYVGPDTEAEPLLSECRNELRLGADGILLAYTPNDGYGLSAFDTTTTPMTHRYRTPVSGAQNDAAMDRMVLSPDGATAYLGSLQDTEPREVRIHAYDVATGDEIASAVVPGTQLAQDGLLHTGELLLVMSTATGGQDDPPRLVALDPTTLDQQWVLAGGDDEDFDRIGRMTLSGDVVVIHASGTLIGVSTADGTVRWTAELSSFSNNGSQIVADGAGRIYASTFGGAVLEIYDAATGAPVFVSPDEREFLGDAVDGEATLGPVLEDGRLYALHRVQGENVPALVAYDNGRARLDGGTGDPIDIAIQLCQYLFAEGQARTVVLSRDDVFADTLAGAPLAGDHSCILFTPGGEGQPLDARTAVEIARALPPGGTVRIAGGVAAVSAEAEATLQADGFDVQRLAGPGRVQTAVAIADVVSAENPGVGSAVLAFAGNWPDAVTAGAAASAIGAPVLLTGTDDLPAETLDALQRYGTTTTTVAGGTAVVSDAVLAQVPGGQRVAGATRHGTATQVAAVMWAGIAADQAFVLANLEFEQGWALALAASPLSVRLGAPQLGVRSSDLPNETADYLTAAGITDPGLIVLGDLTVIDDGVVDSVQATTGG